MAWRDEAGGGMGFWGWSLPVGRWLGVEVRLHWTLLLLTVIEVVGLIQARPPWWYYPAALAIVPLSVVLHEFGHSLTARAVGGDSRDIVLWAYGGLSRNTIPGRWAAHLLVAAAGPLVNCALWLGCLALVPRLGPPADGIVAFAGRINLFILIFNLLPCHPMDGGRVTRSLLWPLVGRRRAVLWTIWLAYVCLGGLLAWAIWAGSLMMAVIMVIMLVGVVGEHRFAREGIDVELGGELLPGSGRSWLARWRERRAERAAGRAERAAAAEQAELDRLLAKVSAGGLPSLTAGERRTLQRISERERERSGR